MFFSFEPYSSFYRQQQGKVKKAIYPQRREPNSSILLVIERIFVRNNNSAFLIFSGLRTYVFDHSMIIATEKIDGVHEYVSTRKGLAAQVVITYIQELTSMEPPSDPKKALALKAQLTAGIAMMLSRVCKFFYNKIF